MIGARTTDEKTSGSGRMDVIWIHRYELIARAPLNARTRDLRREGALIRVDDGFADVHPHPELGDAPLAEQLARLARGETTPLTQQSLYFARVDAEARRVGRSLFEGLIIPESHWPAAAGDAPLAFDTIKVKMPGSELPSRGKLRLDFNETLTAEEFLRIAERLPTERIDFVEDPCPYDGATWRMLRERTGLRLALDRQEATEGVDVLVRKPAVQRSTQDITDVEIVVTSYMDHPVGQMFAAWCAAREATSPRCGLVTHVLFEPNAFSERLRLDGARLIPASFDDLLESVDWKKVA
jgi:O-succinylbenzoate synthase